MNQLRLAAEAMEREAARIREGRKAEGSAGQNLWCVVQFDGNGNRIWRFSSGKGYEGIQVDVGNNRDAEERMAIYFPQMIHEHRRSPASIQMITRATPCRRKCTEIIRGLAARFPSIAAITISSWEPYRGQGPEELEESMNFLNTVIMAEHFDVDITLDSGAKEITSDQLTRYKDVHEVVQQVSGEE